MDKIIIYGAGDFGQKAYAYYAGKHDVVAFMDSDPAKTDQHINGVVVLSPNYLVKTAYDQIFVASSHADEIIHFLKGEYGVASDAIFVVPVSVLHERINSTHLIESLSTLQALLQDNAISYWLDHSSLLGLIRDGDPFGVDVDLAIFSKDAVMLQNLLESAFSKQNVATYRYSFHGRHWEPTDIRQFKLFEGLDIHVKIRHDQSVFWLVGPMLLHADANHYHGFDMLRFGDMGMRVPLNATAYLTHLYGDWEKKPEQWSYSDYKNIERVFMRHEMQGGL